MVLFLVPINSKQYQTLRLKTARIYIHTYNLNNNVVVPVSRYIPGFSIVRYDRLLREGGGVCIYVRNTKSFSVCFKYSNSICDLLIVKLHQPSLIIIIMYRPPTEFNDIILKTKSYIMSLPSPLPNIIMLCDFNFPNIDWSCSITSCPMAGPLIDLAGLLFLNQQVKEPTSKLNILDIIFGPDDLVNYITTTDHTYQFPRPYQWPKV